MKESPGHDLTAHSGILRVETDPEHAGVEVDFDPAVLSKSEVRSLLKEHIAQVESAIRKRTFRLDGHACEACALKLEKKVERIPGVRRATATYLGRILSVTFDSDAEGDDRMVGNIDEWVEDGMFVGGFYARSTTNGCEAKVTVHAPIYYDYSTGARCCRDAQ